MYCDKPRDNLDPHPLPRPAFDPHQPDMSTPEDLVPRFKLERLLNQGKATNHSIGLNWRLPNI